MGVFDMPLRPTPTDGVQTDTSVEQLETERAISALFDPSSPVAQPTLHRQAHIMFLARLLYKGFPEWFMTQDASQPWLVFWVLQSLMALGAALDEASRAKAVAALMRFQHPKGGFAGGARQMPHLLPTYAAVCSLAIVGRPGPGGGWDEIDRAGMYDFFMSLKQPDGSFITTEDGEVDMRGCYCLLTVATLLDLLTPELVEGTAEFIASCQTYEGGFSSASFPFFTSSPSSHLHPRPSLGEAHGGYTFCALASLFLLRPFSEKESALNTGGIDVGRLIRWATSMQGSGVEGGGFRGRTNKLVDGCYSWWVGGLNPMLAELVRDAGTSGDEWEDWEDTLFDKEALQRYILTAAQITTGGLRDKPGKPADAYHTEYNLTGLATAQHRVAPSPEIRQKLEALWKEDTTPFGLGLSGGEAEETKRRRKEAYLASCEWMEDEGASVYVGGEDTRVNAAHPIYNITITSLRKMIAHFYGQEAVTAEVVVAQ